MFALGGFEHYLALQDLNSSIKREPNDTVRFVPKSQNSVWPDRAVCWLGARGVLN